jgi:YbbR domain-containing protein
MMKDGFRSFFATKNLSSIFSREWLQIIVSLILAGVLWSFVGGEDRIDKNVMVPVEIINLPRDLVISNQFKKELEVTVSGPRSVILEMADKAVTRQIDLSQATPGTMVEENGNEDIPVPRGVTVQRVQPSSIILSLDKLIQKQFPVSARTVGRVAPGYYVKVAKTEPDEITITGPQTILSQVDELFTKAINLADIKQSAQIQVPLELEPAIVELIGETSVTVDLVVGLETETRSIEKMKVQVVIDGVTREVQPETVKITANIPKLLLEKDPKLENLFSVTALQQDSGDNLKVTVIPRADIELPIEILSILPESVRLVSENPLPGYESKVPVASESIGNSPGLEIKNLTDGEEAETSTTTDSLIPVLKSHSKRKYSE